MDEKAAIAERWALCDCVCPSTSAIRMRLRATGQCEYDSGNVSMFVDASYPTCVGRVGDREAELAVLVPATKRKCSVTL